MPARAGRRHRAPAGPTPRSSPVSWRPAGGCAIRPDESGAGVRRSPARAARRSPPRRPLRRAVAAPPGAERAAPGSSARGGAGRGSAARAGRRHGRRCSGSRPTWARRPTRRPPEAPRAGRRASARAAAGTGGSSPDYGTSRREGLRLPGATAVAGRSAAGCRPRRPAVQAGSYGRYSGHHIAWSTAASACARPSSPAGRGTPFSVPNEQSTATAISRETARRSPIDG